MGKMVDGQWKKEWYEPDEEGRFVRPDTVFRNWIREGDARFVPESGRYHLYVSHACPWAHRTLIMRALKGLEDVISLSVVDYLMGDEGWTFSERSGAIPDHVNQCDYLRDVYRKADPRYTGRVTVPVLWDKKEATIVNNESLDVMRMLDTAFDGLTDVVDNYYPQARREDIDAMIEQNYHAINNGVYKVGFAASQMAYDEARQELQSGLERCEEILSRRRYLCGDVITEADWCLFTTLIRFDPVYYVHFKCSFRHIYEYPSLWKYLKELYHVPGVKGTCHFDHIRRHYFESHRHLNPTGIVAATPWRTLD